MVTKMDKGKATSITNSYTYIAFGPGVGGIKVVYKKEGTSHSETNTCDSLFQE